MTSLSARWLRSRARRFARRQQWSNASAAYARLTASGNANACDWVQYGHSLKEAGELAGAEGAYRFASATYPNEVDPYRQLGLLLRRIGRHHEAEEALGRAHDLDPSQPDLSASDRHSAPSEEPLAPTAAQPSAAQVEAVIQQVRQELQLSAGQVEAVIQQVRQEQQQQIDLITQRQQALVAERTSDPSLEHRFDAVTHRLVQLEAGYAQLHAGWDQQIPLILAQMASVSAAAAEAGHDVLNARFSGIRRDLERLASRLDANILDMRDRLSASRLDAPAGRNPVTEQSRVRIMSMGAVGAALANELRLQFCGTGPMRAGFVHVAADPRPGIDIQAAIDAPLPFGESVVSAILVSGGLANLSLSTLTDELLPSWFSLLRPGGTLRIEAVDFAAALNQVTSGDLSATRLQQLLEGGTVLTRDGMTEEALRRAMLSAGLVSDTSQEDAGEARPDGTFALQMVKPEPHA